MKGNPLRDYKVENGVIVSPGQFEGEAAYMPTAFQAYLDGNVLEDNGDTIAVEFEYDGQNMAVEFMIDAQGFVQEV
jgi:hypothetical protein